MPLRGTSTFVPATSAEDHRVRDLPGLEDSSIVHYAGHIPIDIERNANLFYWLFEATTKDAESEAPIIIWLNGGPGCSSLIGQFLEVGPLSLNHDGQVEVRPEGWNQLGHLLFIDQPVGTGYSYLSRSGSGIRGGKGTRSSCKNDEECNADFYAFLLNFFSLHSKYLNVGEGGRKVTRRIILTGESHAGHVIPSFTKYVMEKNSQRNSVKLDIDSIVIGNGWIDPMEQYQVTDYSYAMGLITAQQQSILQRQDKICRASLKSKMYNTKSCYRLLDDAIAMTRSGRKRVLIYDVRQMVASDSNFPPGHKMFEHYLNRPAVKKALHADSVPHRFAQCLDPPYFALKHQDGLGVSNELSHILKQGIPVVLFTGQYDLICNFVSLENAIKNLKWDGSTAWKQMEPKRWGNLGWIKSTGSLSSIVFENAGHMVAMDQRQGTLEMLSRVVKRENFEQGKTVAWAELFKRQNIRRQLHLLSTEPQNGRLDGVSMVMTMFTLVTIIVLFVVMRKTFI